MTSVDMENDKYQLTDAVIVGTDAIQNKCPVDIFFIYHMQKEHDWIVSMRKKAIKKKYNPESNGVIGWNQKSNFHEMSRRVK